MAQAIPKRRPGRPASLPGGQRLRDLPIVTVAVSAEAREALEALTARLGAPRWRIVSRALVDLERATRPRVQGVA